MMKCARLALTVVVLLISSHQMGVCCDSNYGTAIGSFRSVTAYSNGGNNNCTGTGDGTYQCVEYVKRFFSQAMHFNTSGWSGNADTYYGSYQTKGLRQFAQGGTTKPKENDLLCFGGSFAGHVAIVASVSSSSITIIDQNRHATNPFLTLGMDVNNGHYTVDDIGELSVQGWLRGYTCQLDHKSPSSVISLYAGQEYNFRVWYKNTSEAASPNWTNDGGDHSIELRSCTSSGTEATCFFLPVEGKPTWLDPTTRKRIIRASNTNIGTDGLAEFDFWGRVPTSASPGSYNIYFRPYHNSGQWIENWDQMCFQIQVQSASGDPYLPLVGCFNAGGLWDVSVYDRAAGGWYVAINSGNNTFAPSETYWLNDWAASATGYTPLVGDFNGDGKTDICAYDKAAGGWYVALNSGSNTFTPSATYWLLNWAAHASAFAPLVGDFNGDGKTDICVYQAAVGDWYVATSNGNNAFSPAATYWLTNWGASASGFTALAGDFNGDGRTDVCLYDKAAGGWYVALNSGGSTFTPSATYWLANWGASATGYIPLAGDFNADGKTDVCLYDKAAGGWYVALNSGSNTFTPSATYWLNGWGVNGKVCAPGVQTLPATFTLNQNYPNPFNPVTTISYSLPSATHVTLDIFNILGQHVTTLVDEQQGAGSHTVQWDASCFASGIYLYRIQAGEATASKKMLLMK